MTSRIGEFVIDCHDPEGTAQFWCSALGYRVTDRDQTGVAIAGHPAAPSILLLKSDDPKIAKNRLHFDICPVDTTQHDEVERLMKLGAKRADIGQGERSWVVLADPDGNEFCVMSRAIPPELEPFHHLDTPSPHNDG
jgi:predicted enzyme related to lactoylglutathione lyase